MLINLLNATATDPALQGWAEHPWLVSPTGVQGIFDATLLSSWASQGSPVSGANTFVNLAPPGTSTPNLYLGTAQNDITNAPTFAAGVFSFTKNQKITTPSTGLDFVIGSQSCIAEGWFSFSGFSSTSILFGHHVGSPTTSNYVLQVDASGYLSLYVVYNGESSYTGPVTAPTPLSPGALYQVGIGFTVVGADSVLTVYINGAPAIRSTVSGKNVLKFAGLAAFAIGASIAGSGFAGNFYGFAFENLGVSGNNGDARMLQSYQEKVEFYLSL